MAERVEIPQSRCRAGVHSADITPPVGIYHRMWGAATHDRSEGVSMPLRVTVLMIGPRQDTDALHAFVAIDHCLFWHTEMETLLTRVEQQTNVTRDQVTLLFSHTHAAGLLGSERAEMPGGELIGPYLESVADEISHSIRVATSRLRDASIVYGVGRCDLARNRDYFDSATETYVCGYNPHGAADDTVIVGRVIGSTSSTPLATLVNYACHPTTLAWENRQISPDYVGGLRDVIEQQTKAPLFFVQGASGDTGPRESYVGDPEIAYRNGRQLGFAALSALETLPSPDQSFEYSGAVVSGATLGTWRWTHSDLPRLNATATWSKIIGTVNLPFREDLPIASQLKDDLKRWNAAERAAAANGNEEAARNARAMAERMTRRLTRVGHLDSESHFPYAFHVWKMGDAIWIALNGEHYNVLQREIRDAFPEVVVIVGTLANGSDVWYLPDKDSYGKGLYQEDASILSEGSLELLRDRILEVMREVLSLE
jgi:hypothetical protein